MSTARILGNNVTLLLRERQIPIAHFAEQLGYSVEEVHKVCDARLYTTEEDIDKIATFFAIPTEELFTAREDAYTGEGFLHCMGSFKNESNKEKILDIFDMYADLKEAIIQEEEAAV